MADMASLCNVETSHLADYNSGFYAELRLWCLRLTEVQASPPSSYHKSSSSPIGDSTLRAHSQNVIAIGMRPHRTCDRCYKIKSQCIFEPAAQSCARCARLGHKCETKRAVLQPGRPRRSSALSKKSPPTRDVTRTVSTQLVRPDRGPALLTGFTDHEVSLIEFTLHPDQISSLIYGRTFHDVMRSALATRLVFATDQLKDGFLAFASALSANKKVHIRDPNSISHEQRGSRALQVLGNIRPSSIEDARTALVLALALITYNDLNVGSPALPITRSALLLAAPYRHKLIGLTTEETDPALICLLFNEAFECLVLGQIPVFRWDPPFGHEIVDRYYGISHELLPSLYDICLLYAAIREQNATTTIHATNSNFEGTLPIPTQTKHLTHNIDLWDPHTTILMRTPILTDPHEHHHFLLQAKAFKSTLQLLLLQSNRSPINDMLASSKALQLETEILTATDHGLGRPMYLLFPYFVAAVELGKIGGEVEGGGMAVGSGSGSGRGEGIEGEEVERQGQGQGQRQAEGVFEVMMRISNGIAPMSCRSMVGALRYIWERWDGYDYDYDHDYDHADRIARDGTGTGTRRARGKTWFECVRGDLVIAMGP